MRVHTAAGRSGAALVAERNQPAARFRPGCEVKRVPVMPLTDWPALCMRPENPLLRARASRTLRMAIALLSDG